MYVISEYVVCIALIFLVAMLLFAPCAATTMILEGSLILSRAACRTVHGAPQRVRRTAALAGRGASILIYAMQG